MRGSQRARAYPSGQSRDHLQTTSAEKRAVGKQERKKQERRALDNSIRLHRPPYLRTLRSINKIDHSLKDGII